MEALARAATQAAAAGMLAAAILGAGCAARHERPAADAAPIFYPPLPNQPRVQFLARFSSEHDLAPPASGFRDFVLGTEVPGTNQLIIKPYGVEIRDGAIYVVDTRNGGWAVLDLVQRRAHVVQPTGAGKLSKPINLCIDTDGTRYVTDTNRNQVVAYDRDNGFKRAFGETGQFQPVDVAVAGDRLYVSDIAHHQVVVLDKQTGNEIRRFGGTGSAEGELFHPTNLALDAEGNVFVTDTGNFRVQKFSADGRLLRVYGEIGTGAGRFARPKGVAVDRAGRLYVVDAAFENIQVLDPDGSPLLFFGSPGDDRDSINLPTAIAIDYDNVDAFRRYAAPGFDIEYVVLVASQFGVNKVVAYGFGTYHGAGDDLKQMAPAASGERP